MVRTLLLALAAISLFVAPQLRAADLPANDKQWVLLGTYTQGGSEGIYVCSLEDGKLGAPKLAGKVKNPSFLALHPSLKFVYAVSEVPSFDGAPSGAVTAFALNRKTGLLTKLNHQSSQGRGPCHVVVDSTGKNVLVANYGSGSVACLPIQKDGSLAAATSTIQHQGSSAHPARQAGPHAHSIHVDPSGKFAVAADLGLDKLLVYRFDAAAGTLKPHDPPFFQTALGAGPRHFAFHPSGKYGYVINELNRTITALKWDADQGAFTKVESESTLPTDLQVGSTAEVQVHPSGKFLYGSNRGHDSLVAFEIDEQTGAIDRIGHVPSGGQTPRNFCVDPTGRYVVAANQGNSVVALFTINPQTGALTITDQRVECPLPVCVKFVPAE